VRIFQKTLGGFLSALQRVHPTEKAVPIFAT
jgi:hypothetical protein